MSIRETLRRSLDNAGRTTYRCRLCSARYQDRPLNCPACGCTTVEPD